MHDPSGGVLVVRRAASHDACDVAALINAAFAEYRGKLKPEASALREDATTIAPQLASPSGGAVAFRMDAAGSASRPLGAALYRPEDGDLYLGRLAVPPPARGQGLAGALIRFVEDEARRRGCAGIVLGVRIALPGNQRLFAGHGFVEVSRHTHDGFAQPTWIRMRKTLHGLMLPTG
jgi:GNAT superfamily N-acetyltransferase